MNVFYFYINTRHFSKGTQSQYIYIYIYIYTLYYIIYHVLYYILYIHFVILTLYYIYYILAVYFMSNLRKSAQYYCRAFTSING